MTRLTRPSCPEVSQAMMVLCHRHGSTSSCPGRLVCSGTQIPAWGRCESASSKLGMLESCLGDDVWHKNHKNNAQWRLWRSWLRCLNFGSIGQASFVMRVALSGFCITDLSSISTILQCAFDQETLVPSTNWPAS